MGDNCGNYSNLGSSLLVCRVARDVDHNSAERSKLLTRVSRPAPLRSVVVQELFDRSAVRELPLTPPSPRAGARKLKLILLEPI
jgi:hypothetical protein